MEHTRIIMSVEHEMPSAPQPQVEGAPVVEEHKASGESTPRAWLDSLDPTDRAAAIGFVDAAVWEMLQASPIGTSTLGVAMVPISHLLVESPRFYRTAVRTLFLTRFRRCLQIGMLGRRRRRKPMTFGYDP